jgi:hypothetical protein
MVKTIYIEDIFIKFFIAMSHNGVGMHAQDINAAASFYQNLIDGDSITEKQGAYILKILNKYKDICAPYYDYRDYMENTLFTTKENLQKVLKDCLLVFQYQLKN